MLKLEPKLEPGLSNPWDNRTLEDFMFFNCPECPFKCQDGDSFVNHCQYHPMAEGFVASIYSFTDDMENFQDNPNDFESSEHWEDEEDQDVEDQEDEEEAGMAPTAFVDCTIEDNNTSRFKPQQAPPVKKLKLQLPPPPLVDYSQMIVVANPELNPIEEDKTPEILEDRNINGRKSWEKELKEGWDSFQEYISYKETFTAQDIISFLDESMRAKKMAVGSMVNLKSRIGINYKNKTGRNFTVDFPEVGQYCKGITAAHRDKERESKSAYMKKKEKEYNKFISFTNKGTDFSEDDLKVYLDYLKKDQKLSQGTRRFTLGAIIHGYQKQTNYDFKVMYPNISNYLAAQGDDS